MDLTIFLNVFFMVRNKSQVTNLGRYQIIWIVFVNNKSDMK